jgi:hypothetical protein
VRIDILDSTGYCISGMRVYTPRNSAIQYLMIVDNPGENGGFSRSFTTVRLGGI